MFYLQDGGVSLSDLKRNHVRVKPLQVKREPEDGVDVRDPRLL